MPSTIRTPWCLTNRIRIDKIQAWECLCSRMRTAASLNPVERWWSGMCFQFTYDFRYLETPPDTVKTLRERREPWTPLCALNVKTRCFIFRGAMSAVYEEYFRLSDYEAWNNTARCLSTLDILITGHAVSNEYYHNAFYDSLFVGQSHTMYVFVRYHPQCVFYFQMMVKCGAVDCLSHPVCSTFLSSKW